MLARPRWDRILVLSSDWRDWLFVPLLAQLVVVTFVLYPAYGAFLWGVGTFSRPANAIFPWTWTAGLLLFLLGFFVFVRADRLDLTRAVVYAVALVFAATSLFEIIFQDLGASAAVGNAGIETQVVNLSAIAFGFSGARVLRPTPLSYALFAAYIAGWMGWWAVGYPQISGLGSSSLGVAFFFNVTLKVATFALAASFLHVSAAFRAPSPTSPRDDPTGSPASPREG